MFLFSDEESLTQKTTMAWKISLIVVIVISASILASEDGETQATAEGIVALNPVLKDHRIIYSDPLSVRSKTYASQATFNPRKKYCYQYLLECDLQY